MSRDHIYDFCQRHSVNKIDIQYRNNDIGLKKFGIVSDPPAALCKLELPEDSLLEIIELEEKARALIGQATKEEELRALYPSVQKAYEDYQILLRLTNKEQNDI